MSYLGRATAIKLTRYVKGTNSLTFQMPTKYFNSELGEYVKNELIEDLYNENWEIFKALTADVASAEALQAKLRTLYPDKTSLIDQVFDRYAK